jgi:hypothetical protein
MIDRNDVIDALSKCAVYDNQHTPVPDGIVLEAWLEHFDQYRHVTREDLLRAVKDYHNQPHDHQVRPVDISTLARGYSRDRIERSDLDSPERLAHEALCEAKGADEVAAIEAAAPQRQQAIDSFARRFGVSPAEAAVRMDPRRGEANERDARQVEVNHVRMSAPAGTPPCPDCSSTDVPCPCEAEVS